MHTTISRHNAHDLDNLCALFEKLAIVMWNVFFLVPVGRGQLNDLPSGEEFAAEQKLREALGDLHIAIVNVSGGQQVLELSGPNVRQVLMKSTSYDVHPNNFPVGKAVGTVFAKSQLMIRHTAEDTWELLIRRSFSDYWWLWLQDASAEFGLNVVA